MIGYTTFDYKRIDKQVYTSKEYVTKDRKIISACLVRKDKRTDER